MSVLSRSNWNLEVLVYEERGKPDKNLSEQGREPTTNSTHIWRRRRDFNPGHIGGRRVLSTLRHPCLWELIKGRPRAVVRSSFFRATRGEEKSKILQTNGKKEKRLRRREEKDFMYQACTLVPRSPLGCTRSNNRRQERIKGTEKASSIHTLFHR